MTDTPKRLGVVGAGTMGAGIAQLGALAGMETVLHDPVAAALEKGASAIHVNIDKGVERERWSPDDAAIAHQRLATVPTLEDLAGCELVIEAAPEQFDLKRELFQRLGDICGPEAVLASNTSSIPITKIAGVARVPENVIGLHFFNPAPLMKLVELISALQSSDDALARGRAVGDAMRKHVIDAKDGPGFLVNRCGRPFGSEALRILQERLATPEEIDAIYRQGGGYRMGPFELMDLVGIDVGFAVARSFAELSFGEPRWRPNPLQAQMVAAGLLGRKTGKGWYDYADGPPQHEEIEVGAEERELLNRVQCCIVNEAMFALGEGVGSEDDIDAGVKLGLNWPKGSIELGRELGFDHVLATMDALFDRYHEERYRAAPLLRDHG
ncbi:MAG TPA: 3-hydroxyacyl-CoA dehydrogenase NAD-binding domain-containing protein [Thermoleophilaceae bacterium]